MQIKDSVNFQMILRSDEPNFMTLKKQWGLLELAKPVMALTDSFLRSAYPDQVDIASDVAVAMIDREPTWTLLDVVNFYKTIINRQDLEGFNVFGNKITVLKLMQMVGEYEGLKADERTIIVTEEKEVGRKRSEETVAFIAQSGKVNPELMKKKPIENPVAIKMGKDLEKTQIRDDHLKPYSSPADENYFKKYTEPQEYDEEPSKENIV